MNALIAISQEGCCKIF